MLPDLSQPSIREIDPDSPDEIELVATRMRRTLIDVLGAERGSALYTLDWLRARVRWHLDPVQTTAKVFLSEDSEGHVTGHTIVRVEVEGGEEPFGIFSTIYVEPAFRRQGIATALLLRGEQWLREQGLARAVTNTAETNQRLIDLFARHGYAIQLAESEMVQLGKALRP